MVTFFLNWSLFWLKFGPLKFFFFLNGLKVPFLMRLGAGSLEVFSHIQIKTPKTMYVVLDCIQDMYTTIWEAGTSWHHGSECIQFYSKYLNHWPVLIGQALSRVTYHMSGMWLLESGNTSSSSRVIASTAADLKFIRYRY